MSKKIVPPNERGIPTIREYLKAKEEYSQYWGRITPDGKSWVLYKGEWIPQKKFNKLVKKPIVPNFAANLNNPDKTKLWMHS